MSASALLILCDYYKCARGIQVELSAFLCELFDVTIYAFLIEIPLNVQSLNSLEECSI